MRAVLDQGTNICLASREDEQERGSQEGGNPPGRYQRPNYGSGQEAGGRMHKTEKGLITTAFSVLPSFQKESSV